MKEKNILRNFERTELLIIDYFFVFGLNLDFIVRFYSGTLLKSTWTIVQKAEMLSVVNTITKTVEKTALASAVASIKVFDSYIS